MRINKYIIIFIFYPIIIFSQQKDQKGYILFPECENSVGEDKNNCNEYELRKFIAHNIAYLKRKKNNKQEGKVWIEYVLTKDEKLLVSISKNSKITSELKKSVMEVMDMLKDSIQSGKISIIPAQLNGEKVISYFTIPVEFSSEKKEIYFEEQNSRKIVIATYRTTEKTVQFRRDLNGIIYVYLLLSNKETLLGQIDLSKKTENFNNEEKSFMFLYNIIFLKSEILLTMGKIDGEYYELFMDKNTSKSEDKIVAADSMNINVYSSKNFNKPIETFKSVDQLFSSKYLPLLFK